MTVLRRLLLDCQYWTQVTMARHGGPRPSRPRPQIIGNVSSQYIRSSVRVGTGNRPLSQGTRGLGNASCIKATVYPRTACRRPAGTDAWIEQYW